MVGDIQSVGFANSLSTICGVVVDIQTVWIRVKDGRGMMAHQMSSASYQRLFDGVSLDAIERYFEKFVE